jgi:hypothetical protein
VSATVEREPLGSLYDYALQLHERNPDGPLPRDGEPYPDAERHGRRRSNDPEFWRNDGVAVAVVLDRHFADPHAQPAELVDPLHDVDVPIHDNDHIAAAALRADRQRVLDTGRWLVRHGTDRCSVTVGLALLATDYDPTDIDLIRTIGLLSNRFGPLAAKALRRRHDGGHEALLWLAQRVAGWGRVYVVEELCRYVDADARAWLLRNSCDGDYLNGYYAWKVATAAHLHEAIVDADADDDVVDHTGRLLRILAGCSGMGSTLEHYPPAPIVLAAHAAHLSRQEPTADRYIQAATIAARLTEKPPEKCGCTAPQRDAVVRGYLTVLDRQEWRDIMGADHGLDDEYYTWFASTVARQLNLEPFRVINRSDDQSR